MVNPSMSDPSLVPRFNAYGAKGLQPKSQGEFFVPISSTNAVWRVVAAYWELPPSSGGIPSHLWIARRLLKSRQSYIRFLTAPDVPSNKRRGVDAGRTFLFAFLCPCPGATHRGCWAAPAKW